MAGNRVQWRHVRGGRRRPCPPSPVGVVETRGGGEEQVPWPPSSLQGHAPGLFGKGLLVLQVGVMAIRYAPVILVGVCLSSSARICIRGAGISGYCTLQGHGGRPCNWCNGGGLRATVFPLPGSPVRRMASRMAGGRVA